MRLRTPLASVWVDDSTDTLSSAPAASSSGGAHSPASTTSASSSGSPTTPVSQIQWACRAYTGKLGRYVAVRLRQGILFVAIAETGRPLRWVRADSALTEAQAQAWLRTGFNR